MCIELKESIGVLCWRIYILHNAVKTVFCLYSNGQLIDS